MGSGGPRGLQIPRSGVQSARGGFDSHAFPPWFAVLAAAALSAAVTPHARAEEPLPAAAAPDSSRAPAARVIETPRPAAAPASAPRASRFDQPRWVMLRSLLVPGWGQLHNRAWLKSLAVAGGEALLATRMLDDERALERLSRDVEAARREGDDVQELAAVNAYNLRLDRLIAREWLFAGLLTYALLDAYVDAHFRGFRIEFQHDPALPEGGATPAGARAGLRWSF